MYTRISSAYRDNNNFNEQTEYDFEANIPQKNTKTQIAEVKELQDFSGNIYCLAEFSPSGYMIYHPSSGNIVEGTSESPSPYKDIDKDLYYAGPTYYYHKIGNTYYHTIDDQSISGQNVLDCITVSNQLNNVLVQNINSKNLKIEKTASTRIINSPIGQYDVLVDDYSLFYNLRSRKQIGYYGDGVCGYIAAGMLLLYYDYRYNDDIIDDDLYLNATGTTFIGDSFTRLLRSKGSKDSTTAQSIRAPIVAYGRDIGVDLDGLDSLLPTRAWFKKRIDNDQPAILFGNLTDAGNHAVLVYGYDPISEGSDAVEYLIAHYGWEDYYYIHVSGLIGSGYYLTSY